MFTNQNKLKKVILSVTTDLITDQRVNKVANLLTENGYVVLLVGRLKADSIILEKRSYNTHRFKLFFNKGFLFYFEYNLRLFFFRMMNQM